MVRNPMAGNSLERRVGLTEHQNMSISKLFVGNLSFNTTENDLQDTFAAHGAVLEVNLLMDRDTGRPRGFGFVTMSTPEEAQTAIRELNGKSIDGRALTVNEAKPREERSGGDRRSGGGQREYSGARNRY
jgi:cold-inducible RNA-binding protein